MNVGPGEPRGRNKAERLQSKSTQPIDATLHTSHCGAGVQRQELTFSSGPADGADAVSRAAG
jgi:hypothetical protein